MVGWTAQMGANGPRTERGLPGDCIQKPTFDKRGSSGIDRLKADLPIGHSRWMGGGKSIQSEDDNSPVSPGTANRATLRAEKIEEATEHNSVARYQQSQIRRLG